MKLIFRLDEFGIFVFRSFLFSVSLSSLSELLYTFEIGKSTQRNLRSSSNKLEELGSFLLIEAFESTPEPLNHKFITSFTILDVPESAAIQHCTFGILCWPLDRQCRSSVGQKSEALIRARRKLISVGAG